MNPMELACTQQSSTSAGDKDGEAQGLWGVALAYASKFLAHGVHMAGRDTIKGKNVPEISDEWTEEEVAQIQQGFRDACLLAQAGFEACYVLPDVPADQQPFHTIFPKYFPADANTQNQVAGVFGAIVAGTLPLVLCSPLLERFTVMKDFPNPDNKNELCCTDETVMASTRNGNHDNLDPIMILCPSALAHGNIGPPVIDKAPALVKCDDVKADGHRTTWRMDTLGSTIFHEYTHFADLVAAALPHGSKDSLNRNDDLSVPKEDTFYYGPYEIQNPLRSLSHGAHSSQIADSYTWFANEAFWSSKCAVQFGLAHDSDDNDPRFEDSPGLDPESNDSGPS